MKGEDGSSNVNNTLCNCCVHHIPFKEQLSLFTQEVVYDNSSFYEQKLMEGRTFNEYEQE
jgi:hypothetical protein